MIVRLNINQFDYLNNSFCIEQEELRLRLNEVSIENQFIIIKIDEELAIDIRDWAMDKQMQIGFDINYELTSEGKILEELIRSEERRVGKECRYRWSTYH